MTNKELPPDSDPSCQRLTTIPRLFFKNTEPPRAFCPYGFTILTFTYRYRLSYSCYALWVIIPFCFGRMMFYHDGLRIIVAENARHSSMFRAPPLILLPSCPLIPQFLIYTFPQNLTCSLVILLSYWVRRHPLECCIWWWTWKNKISTRSCFWASALTAFFLL